MKANRYIKAFDKPGSIKPKQLAAVCIITNAIFDNDKVEIANFLAENYNITSRKYLSFNQAIEIIDRYGKHPSVPAYNSKKKTARKKYTGTGERGAKSDRITSIQAERIGILQKLLSWKDNAFYAFLNRQLSLGEGVNTHPDFLKKNTATKVLIGMEKILFTRDFIKKLDLNYEKINRMTNDDLKKLLKLKV